MVAADGNRLTRAGVWRGVQWLTGSAGDALELIVMLTDLEYTYSPVRERVRELREYL